MKMLFQNAKMMLNGYKRVNLRDTRGVLNKTNNHKWVKTSKCGLETTILPSGSKVERHNTTAGNEKIVYTHKGKEFFRSESPDKKRSELTFVKPFPKIIIKEPTGVQVKKIRQEFYNPVQTYKYIFWNANKLEK